MKKGSWKKISHLRIKNLAFLPWKKLNRHSTVVGKANGEILLERDMLVGWDNVAGNILIVLQFYESRTFYLVS